MGEIIEFEVEGKTWSVQVDEGVIYLQGPTNRALAIGIELPTLRQEHIKVRVTEDGYGRSFAVNGLVQHHSDGGPAIPLPVSPAEMEE